MSIGGKDHGSRKLAPSDGKALKPKTSDSKNVTTSAMKATSAVEPSSGKPHKLRHGSDGGTKRPTSNKNEGLQPHGSKRKREKVNEVRNQHILLSIYPFSYHVSRLVGR